MGRGPHRIGATGGGDAPVTAGPVVLRVDVTASAGDWDPRREPDTQVAGGFTGRVIGLYAARGTVGFDWFDYEPVDDPST